MKKLTAVLTGVFVIGGVSAIGFATGIPGSGGAQEADLSEGSFAETVAEISNEEKATDTEQNSGGKLTADEAVAVAQDVLDGKLDEVELDTEDGRLVYEVELEYKGEDYDFKIDAYTAEIIEIEDDLLKTGVAEKMAVSVDEVKDIIGGIFPEGTIDDIELEKKNGRYIYEVEVDYRDEDGDVYIDAETGEVLKIDDDLKKMINSGGEKSKGNNGNTAGTNDSSENGDSSAQDQKSDERISYKKAEEIALAYVGKGYVDDIELEWKKGKPVFEVEVEYGDDDVDVYIDAYTGEVVYVD